MGICDAHAPLTLTASAAAVQTIAMLIEHVDPERGRYLGPGIVPRPTRDLLGLADAEIADLQEEGGL